MLSCIGGLLFVSVWMLHQTNSVYIKQNMVLDNKPIDGFWSEWESWSTCGLDCQWNRSRECTPPLHGGAECEGLDHEIEACIGGECVPIHGVWSAWDSWSTCGSDCRQTRTRVCTPPQHGGDDCEGLDQETRNCSGGLCPADGIWSAWESWTTCSSGCQRNRTRVCTPPLNGGAPCEGLSQETENCIGGNCIPINGVWSAWSNWTTCSRNCRQNRTRVCTPPQHGGADCSGSSEQNQQCAGGDCPRCEDLDGYQEINSVRWMKMYTEELSFEACKTRCEGDDARMSTDASYEILAALYTTYSSSDAWRGTAGHGQCWVFAGYTSVPGEAGLFPAVTMRDCVTQTAKCACECKY